MGSAVDPYGQAADNVPAVLRKCAGEFTCVPCAVRAGITTADNGNAGSVQTLRVALDVQQPRRVGDLLQQAGIVRVIEMEQMTTGLPRPLPGPSGPPR